MSVVVLKGHPTRGIPRNSKVHVIELPDLVTVWEGVASGVAHVNLDPGKYRYGVNKYSPDHQDDIKFIDEFLHEVTEEQWNRLRFMKPKMVRARNTSQGVRWSCDYPGCQDVMTSRVAALDHEASHFGSSLLETLAKPVDAPVIAAQIAQVQEKAGNFVQRMAEAAKNVVALGE